MAGESVDRKAETGAKRCQPSDVRAVWQERGKTLCRVLCKQRTSECSDVTLDEPGMAWRREREELCPLPSTLPPRTSNEPCFVSCSEFSASHAASCKNREWRPEAIICAVE